LYPFGRNRRYQVVVAYLPYGSLAFRSIEVGLIPGKAAVKISVKKKVRFLSGIKTWGCCRKVVYILLEPAFAAPI
jgi:hypothetical protein